ncbi:MAG: hypothetical protein ACI9WC_002279, partial [Arenicella sp.]
MDKKSNTPKWASESDISEMKEKSSSLMVQVKEKQGPALMRVLDSIGSASQKRMVSANDLMAGSVNSLLKGLDGKSPAGEKLLELRSVMDELNPHSLHNKWWFSWMPQSVKRNAVSKFVHKYQPMQTHVNEVLNGLRAGKDDLLETNLELEQQYNEIYAAQKEIQAEIHVGELVIGEVETLQSASDLNDPQEKSKLSQVVNKAARRVRDLRTMELAAVQFFVSIDQTVASNELLSEQIDSALAVGPMVMTNALRIQAALAKQKSIQAAVTGFQEGLGDLMAQNATAVNQAANEIGDLYNNPVIALEKMEEGFDQLMQAVATANETMATSTIRAKETSAKLAEMTSALNPVAEALRDSKNIDQEPELIEKEIDG